MSAKHSAAAAAASLGRIAGNSGKNSAATVSRAAATPKAPITNASRGFVTVSRASNGSLKVAPTLAPALSAKRNISSSKHTEASVNMDIFKASHPTPKEADAEPIFPPPANLFNKKNPTPHVASLEAYEKLYKQSIQDPEAFWTKMSDELISWTVKPKQVRAGNWKEGDFTWFTGGQLNVAYNCVDRHAEKNPDKTAIIWESDEPGEHEYISYGKVLAEVSKAANMLKSYGIKKGDHVAIYMPMVPEALYAMLACARIGAVHCVVFAGFSSDALRDRIQDCGAKVVITADESKRGGKVHGLKLVVDRAVSECPSIQKTIVFRRTGEFNIPMLKGRDVWWHEEMVKQRPYCPPEPMDPEDPLFILYTSGSTGKPKGLLHTTGGYLLGVSTTFKYIFDYHENDIYACMADVGWITGHSYILYGPMSLGAPTVVFESIPTYPDAGRFWQTVETHKITQLYTAPTAIRLLRKFGDDFVTKYDRSSLRVIGSVGEPINPEAWLWYYKVCGNEQAAVVDTYWQTETGSVIMTTLPGAHSTKPGACAYPFFGIEPVMIDAASGTEIAGNDVGGVLALRMQKGAFPSIARTCLGDHKRYLETYFSVYPGYYFTGDGATRDKDGYYWIRGRVDDVINVSGHRISTSEVESALVSHPAVSESACCSVPDDVTGEALAVFVVSKAEDSVPLAPSHENHEGHRLRKENLKKALIQHVRGTVGPFAAPKKMYIVPDLPKTRSGKIMRRILRKVASGDVKDEAGMAQLGDLSTLADPSSVAAIIKIVHDVPDLKLKMSDHLA